MEINPLTALMVVQRLAETPARADKEQVIFAAFMQGETDFFIGARLALDPLVTFGVTKVAEIVEDDGEPGDFEFSDFMELANDLWRRKLSGASARTAINDAANRCHALTWNMFYRRILLKDFGVSAASINRVIDKLIALHPEAAQHRIPVFGCQMPYDAAQYPKRLHGPKRAEIKLDGVRMLSMLDTEAKTVSLFTGKGKILDNLPSLEQALSGLLAKLPGSMVLDGQLVSSHGVSHLHSLVSRKTPQQDESVRYAVFDILPLADFRAGYCGTPQHERHGLLVTLQGCGLWQTSPVSVVPQIEVDLDTDDGRAALTEFSQRAIAEKVHAIVLKDTIAPYTTKRSAAWLVVPCEGLQRYCHPRTPDAQ